MENETKTDVTDGQDQAPEQESAQVYKPQWRPQDADREYIKITTRKRIRETVAHPMHQQSLFENLDEYTQTPTDSTPTDTLPLLDKGENNE